MRRAAVSISSNIAEGAARKTAAERRRFFEIARSSLVEIDTQIEISVRLAYLSDMNITSLSEKINQLFAMLSRLIEKTK
jgi:four helix bundle protein